MKAIAYCGLACCVCSENKDCAGCQEGGCMLESIAEKSILKRRTNHEKMGC